jgi:hypothetical protein
MPHPAPARPWERVGVDIFTHAGQDYVVSVDYLSGYFEVDRLPSKRATDVIYALRQQWARHGIPAQCISDNSPFGSAEFREFARCWEFEHITSSPNYPQSNGRAEAAVKMAKKLMEKAAEAGNDPLLALLEWRNTPSETLGQSPTQLMFGRRTRTRLPMTERLLSAPFAPNARSALIKLKERQAAYYDRSARERPPLSVGQTVRVRCNDEWRKAEIKRTLPHRSYQVQMEDGTTRRRTSRHIRFSSESPIVVTDTAESAEIDGTTGVNASGVMPTQAQTTQQRVSAKQPEREPVKMTRSGRIIRTPKRYTE